ncbi:MAG: class I SAM-dependent methyltransferase [Pseudanabaenaceae cyanobacterium]|jgi:SAM-dependent methyltransferase
MADPKVTQAVAQLYDTYPFPPEPILDVPPPGYNWRWHWGAAYSFCSGGVLPSHQRPRILDAGCGSGVSTEYLAHLNPGADIVAIDISAGTLAVAQERINRTCPPDKYAATHGERQIEFRHLSLFDADQLDGQFDLINSVGVLHHTADPIRGIQALAAKLAPGGIFHIFVYAAIGRWEISLMQQALGLLSKAAPETQGDFRQGVKLGRDVFAALPEGNRLVQREKQRWAMENQRDECFADMYLHPQEIDYTIDSLFELIDASGLEFVGFSNPQVWSLARLLGKNPELLAQAERLSQREQYRLIELLDTDITHYEFFLAKPPSTQTSFTQANWELDDNLLAAVPLRHPCLEGWPSHLLFDADYQVVDLTPADLAFMHGCDGENSVGAILGAVAQYDVNLSLVRNLLARRLIVFAGN